MDQNTPTPSSQKLASALAGTPIPVRYAGEESGRSLAEMAQRDLDAALQLLADRAQYITGASGAAIALRRDGRNDMLCRASTGPNAPELGALLSTEFGLSGESVRTRQLLRCDDAERDARVNREVCRQLGIASVVVMPVVHDDQVLGVFELFSGKAHAFGERDLSAIQRLSEMVETAVRLAQTAEVLPDQLKEPVSAAPPGATDEAEGQFVTDLVIEEVSAAVPAVKESEPAAETSTAPVAPLIVKEPAPETPIVAFPTVVQAAQDVPAVPVVPESAPKKTLFWSAALDLDAEADKPGDADQSHVPPVLRGLKKCEACGFPVSAGRVLCVECEEKKWRGQLRTSIAASRAAAAKSAPSVPPPASSPAPQKLAAQAFAAAAPSMAKAAESVPASIPSAAPTANAVHPSAPTSSLVALPAAPATQAAKESIQPVLPTTSPSLANAEPAPEKPVETVQSASPALVFSAALPPPQSWFSRNKYILGALLAIAGAAAAVFFLR